MQIIWKSSNDYCTVIVPLAYTQRTMEIYSFIVSALQLRSNGFGGANFFDLTHKKYNDSEQKAPV